MKKISDSIEKNMPLLEKLAKIKKLFSSSKSFWSVISLLIVFLISQLTAIIAGERISNFFKSFIDDKTPYWLKNVLELIAGYFSDAADWLVIGVVLVVIVILSWVKIKESHTSEDIIEDIKDLKKDKETENYLISRIRQLENELLLEKSKQHSENREMLIDEILELKSKLLALEIDDNVIDKAQKIIDKEKKVGIPKALEIIENAHFNSKIEKLREQNKKQAKISRYKAGLHERIFEWSKADSSYREAIEFDASYDNYFDYAYFLQVKQANYTDSDRYYNLALQNTNDIVKKASILNNLAAFHAKDSTKWTEAEKEYNEALEIRRYLAKENPEIYKSDVAMTLNNLANFHAKDSTKRAEAEKEYNEVLEIRRDLAAENLEIYGYDCAVTLIMGVDYFDMPKENLNEATKLLAPYDDRYQNIKQLREVIVNLS